MTPTGLARLQADEGRRLSAYPDPYSPLAKAQRLPDGQRPAGWQRLPGDPWTVGYGQTGVDSKGQVIGPSTVWSAAKCDSEFLLAVAAKEAELRKALPWFSGLDPVRRDVVVMLDFNLGLRKMMSWSDTMGALADHDWKAAADHLRHEGAWNEQVGDRALRMADAVETGSW